MDQVPLETRLVVSRGDLEGRRRRRRRRRRCNLTIAKIEEQPSKKRVKSG